MDSFYYNSSTIIKYLRKVLNEINKDYVDSGLRAGFIMKRFCERNKFDADYTQKLVLLCVLKDIGCFYHDQVVDTNNDALVAASSYAFLKHCSPFGVNAKPLLFYRAKYLEDIENDDYYSGLLITLIDQVVRYNYEEYTLDEIADKLYGDDTGRYNPNQIKLLIKLLRSEPDILEKLNQKNSLFVYEVTSYLQHSSYSNEELLKFIDMTNFSFEFHNHETLAHTVTVAVIAKELAKLTRLTEDQIACIELAALVHDIGKMRIPVSILCKPGKLEDDEYEIMKKHVIYTKEIIDGCFSYKIVDIAANHHEKIDGSGYPRGLKAIDLSIGDKIISVADVASALYCRRSYKQSYPKEKIIEILKTTAAAGTQDARVIKHLLDNFDYIMGLAQAEEAEVLNKYESMKAEYDALATSDSLKKFFE